MAVTSVAAMAVSPRVAVPSTAAQVAGAAAAPASDVSGPTFSKSLATPDPVPHQGQLRAMELMNSGAMFRYTPGVLSETALAEQAICEYTGFKYAVGFNSCGSALFIALKCAGVEPSDQVLCNAFSFTAVPSAVHHAGAIPAYVESNDGFVVDMADLEKKIASSKSKYLMLTHMRGKVADISRAYELAEEHGITVVEDCAHALGIQWEGQQLGRKAKVACFSSQSAKMINSGEGGFLCTDDEEIAAKAICYAGCYEGLVAQHIVAPSREVFDRVKKQTPNYSLRMSDLTACCVRPQIDTLEERIEKYNRRYDMIVEQLAPAHGHFHIPPIDGRVRPVCDSLQINLRVMGEEDVSRFLEASKRRGLPVGLFGSKDNARNFRNWQYSPIATDVEFTERMIACAIDVRLPLQFEDEEILQIGRVLLAALDDTMGEGSSSGRH